jgi:asparagine synthase (glutamine-hydrolysing)
MGALGTESGDLGAGTDPDLVLAAYSRWGVTCLGRIVGDFAFALWDGSTRTLVCARDPLGVKPLYYHWDGARLLFGSEVEALFSDRSVPRRPDEATIADFLLMGFRDPAATFFAGIRQLPPAHALLLTQQGLRLQRYWDVDPSRELRYARPEDYLDEFRERFSAAVRCRLRGASPAGIFLSGGIDSTLVAAVAETVRRHDAGAPELAAFILLADCFLEEEWEAVEALGATYGTEMHPIRLPPDQTFLELYLESAETPHYDAFLTIPVMLEPAAARGCRVVLTGIGGDELSRAAERGFVDDLLLSGRLRRFVRETRRRMRAYGDDRWPRDVLERVWAQLPSALRRAIKALAGRQVPSWIEPGFARRVRLDRWSPARPARRFPTRSAEETYRDVTRPAMVVGLNHVDGNAARFAVECRHPYLDRRLIEFFLATPTAVKLRDGYRKQFVQRSLAGIVPGPIREVERQDEFIPAMAPATSARLEAARLERDLFRGGARIFRYVARTEAERMRDEYFQSQAPHGTLLWNFMVLEAWLQRSFPEWPELEVAPGGSG